METAEMSECNCTTLRKALASVGVPLEVLYAQSRHSPYRELTVELQDAIRQAVEVVREALSAPPCQIEQQSRVSRSQRITELEMELGLKQAEHEAFRTACIAGAENMGSALTASICAEERLELQVKELLRELGLLQAELDAAKITLEHKDYQIASVTRCAGAEGCRTGTGRGTVG